MISFFDQSSGGAGRLLLALLLLCIWLGAVQAAELKLVQSGSFSSSSATTHTIAINPVDTGKSFLIFQTRHNSSRPGGSAAAGRIATASTLEFMTTRNDPIDIQWYLVEFESGVKVQRGEVYQSSATVNVPVTPVASLGQAFVTWSKAINGSHSTWGSDDPVFMRLTATNNLQLRSSASTSNHRVWWQVVEYTDAADIRVQHGTTSIASNKNDQTVAINSVDLNKSIILAANRIAGDAKQINRHTLSAEFSDSGTLLFSRHREGGNVSIPEIGWQVVEFNDGTLVQSGMTRVSKNSLTEVVSLSAVNPNLSIALGSVQPAGGQNMGRTKYKDDDIPGVTAFTLGLTGNTLTLQRNNDLHEASIGWFVVEFPAIKLAEWRMDEATWDGSAGEVTDHSGNGHHGAAEGDTNTLDPGPLCRAATFDGGGDYIQVNNLSDLLNNSASLAFWLNTTQTGNNTAWRAPGVTGVEQSGGTNDIFWGWLDAAGHIGITVGNDNSAKSTTAINDGTWHHVVLTRDAGNGAYKIYIDGVLNKSGAIASGVIGTDYSSIGRIEDTGGSPEYFRGELDEIIVFDGVLGDAEVHAGYANQSAGNNWDGSARPCIASAPILTGLWRSDEPSWDGTLGEVIDTSGYGHHGTSVSGANTSNTSAARAGDPGTCSYGLYDGVNDFVNVPHTNALNPESFSVSLWARVDGGSGTWRSPITSRGYSGSDRYGYNLYAGTNNRWQFWTGTGGTAGNTWNILTGPTVTNGWTHVVATFEKGSDAGSGTWRGIKRLYINGALVATNANAYYRPMNSGYAANLTIGAGGQNGSSYRFNGAVDEVRVYNGVVDASGVSALYAETHPCPASTDAFGFNCLENGANALTGRLYTKLVGQPFTIDVAALKDANSDGTADTVETDFAKDADRTVTVELIDTSTPAACAAYPILSPTVNQSLLFSAADTGLKTSAPFTINKAYRSLGCRVTDSTAATPVVGCSTDQFSVRPLAMSLNAPVLSNGGSGGTPTAVAGSNFTLEADTDDGYDGTPLIDSSKLDAHTGAVAVGTLAGSFSAASPLNGTASGTVFTYSEVGNFRLLTEGLFDASFTAVDQGSDCTSDFSNSVVGGKVGCNFGNTVPSNWVGRFIPADFTLTITDQGALENSCVAGGFSYTGTPISYAALQKPAATITARNSGGVTTQNYTGAYNKLSTSDINMPNFTTDGTQLGVDGVNKVGLIWNVGVPLLTDNANGTLRFALSGDTFVYSRNVNDLVAPFTSDVDLTVQSITDSDGVIGTGLPQAFSPTGVPVRYGRLAMQNAQGSELLPLNVPLRAEYYDGITNGFVANVADVCTQVIGLSLNDLDGTDGLDATTAPSRNTAVYAPATIAGGFSASDLSDVSLLFVHPPVGGEFNLNLQPPGQGNTGSAGVEVDGPPWLEYNWSGAVGDPSAKATFGVFGRPSSLIYQREAY